ncbi:MAG: hypothetical protein EP318_07910 [Rhodobacteraceae bacterium]|nr:MAG: hypothetical protein EP318_07910 [Paracoccaceae bacterium]
MHLLHEEIERNENLSGAISELTERTSENPAKQGLILDINPIWRIAQRLDDAGLDPDIFERWHLEFPRYWPWQHLLGPDSGGPRPDLGRRYPIVDFFTSHARSAQHDTKFQPFLLRLIAKPEPADQELVEQHTTARRNLVGAARESRILTVVETHPLPQLLLSPGSRLTAGTGQAGTLGGYLRDRTTGNLFAATCGHIFPSGAASSSGWTIAHVVQPTTSPPGAPCTANCAHITDIDLALLSGTTQATNVAQRLAGAVWNGQLVDMDGATSGQRTYEIGGAVVEHEIGGACWRKLIQVHAPLGGILHPAAQVALTPTPKPGDSGAWLRQNTNEWAGMIVVSNALFGYALCSDLLVNEANQQFSLDLEVA